MALTGTEPMSSFAGDRIDSVDLTGGHDPRFAVEVSDEGNRATLIFNEPLAFHADLAKRYTPEEWKTRTDADGELTAEFEEVLLERLRGYLWDVLPSVPEYIGTTDGGDYEPNFTIEISADYLEGETFDQWHARIAWPIIATLINVSDPGTFNKPYWFA
jgi:hypothetical protein